MKEFDKWKEREKLTQWALENTEHTELHCKKGQVYALSCGTKTYTWLVKKGVLFTALQSGTSEGELANSIWCENHLIHSLDNDIMLPLHALTECTLIRIPSDEFNRKVRADADLSWALAEYYHFQFTHTLDNYKHAALDSSEDRLAYLERVFDGIDDLEGEKVSDATLALFMGMHRVSVSRIRKKVAEVHILNQPIDKLA